MTYEVQILPEHQKAIEAFLDTIEADPNAEEFHATVDYVSLELHDYMDVIKHPMDLSTLRKNFFAG